MTVDTTGESEFAPQLRLASLFTDGLKTIGVNLSTGEGLDLVDLQGVVNAFTAYHGCDADALLTGLNMLLAQTTEE